MNNSKTILTVVLLMAGTLLTTTAVTIVPAAYAGGDDHDDDNGDGNKNKAEDESNAALADCDDNDVERAGFDCFAIAGDEEEENVIPPVEVGCPEDTVWDITIRGEAEQGGVPIGTVICLIQGLGNHPALVIPPGEEEFETNVNTNQPNVANCNAPEQQLAEVTSGIPPNPLEMGSSLCATVDLA